VANRTASNWSCHRMLEEHKDLFEIPKDGGDKPIYFTGEMVCAPISSFSSPFPRSR
jgi:hypothetical protein